MLYCLKKKVEKWSFLDQNHGLICLEKCQFFDFLNLFFYSLKWCFFVLEYRKRHFLCLYCLKKKLEKLPILDQSNGLTPLEKSHFFDYSKLLFFGLERRFFVLEYRKRHFLGLYWIKKKVGKMAIFGPKQWVKRFRKKSIFRLFELVVFWA